MVSTVTLKKFKLKNVSNYFESFASGVTGYIDGELVLFNMLGLELHKKNISNKLTKINLSDFENGSYFIFLKKDALIKKNRIIKVVQN